MKRLFKGLLFLIIAVSSLSVKADQHSAKTLSLGLTLEPPHLDPTQGAAAAIDEIVYDNVFQGLTVLNEQGDVLPSLASLWKINSKGTIYTFYLKKNVLFHDKTSFSAEDVKFSFERAAQEGSGNAQPEVLKNIQKVVVLDPHKVQFYLKQPDSYFLNKMAWGDFVIVAPESVQTNKTHPIGTGPYRFKSWTRGTKVVLSRNKDYNGQVNFEEVTFYFVREPATALSALQTGQIDAFPNFPAPELLRFIKKNPLFEVEVGMTEGETLLVLNHKDPLFQDKRVRQALNYGIDRESLIQSVTEGFASPIGSHFPPQNPAYVDLSKRYSFDREKAESLLLEAGVPVGTPLKLTVPPPSYARRSSEIIAFYLDKLGFDVSLEEVEWSVWLDQVYLSRNYQMTIVSHTEPMDIDLYARKDYYFGYENQDFRAVFLELEKTIDPQKQRKFLAQAQEILSEDAVHVFLFQLPKYGVWKKQVKGLWRNSPLPANVLSLVHRDKN